MTEFKSDYNYDILFQHHYGKGVDIERRHGFWGRCMKVDAPVPEGFVHRVFVPDDRNTAYSDVSFAVCLCGKPGTAYMFSVTL